MIAGLAWLAVFSLLYTVGDEVGAWPKLPPGAFRDVDLYAGLIAGALFLVLLLAPGAVSRSADAEIQA